MFHIFLLIFVCIRLLSCNEIILLCIIIFHWNFPTFSHLLLGANSDVFNMNVSPGSLFKMSSVTWLSCLCCVSVFDVGQICSAQMEGVKSALNVTKHRMTNPIYRKQRYYKFVFFSVFLWQESGVFRNEHGPFNRRQSIKHTHLVLYKYIYNTRSWKEAEVGSGNRPSSTLKLPG